jgi:DHA2 family methylenomycin A resistance protein-like MFS transporter
VSGARSLRVALCGGYFLILLDVTVVNVALPRIGADLAADAAGRAWVVDAYTVPLAALLLVAGAVGDRVGHRRIVVAGFAGFGLASLVCAAAPSLPVLAVGRAVQGIAAALMLPGTLALLVDTARGADERPRLVGLWAAVGGTALPAGPLLGGLLVQAAGWRAVFWLNVPAIAAAIVPVLGARRPPRRPEAGRALVDWGGGAALVVLVGSAVAAIVEVRDRPGVSAGAAVPALLSVPVLRATERRTGRSLLEVPRGARRPLLAACGVAGLMNLCTVGSLFLLTQVFQDVHRTGPMAAGLLMLPAMAPLPLLGAPGGRLVQRFGAWPTAAAGLATAAVGLVVVSASLGGPSYPTLLPGLALWGAGLGVLAGSSAAAGFVRHTSLVLVGSAVAFGAAAAAVGGRRLRS